MEGGHPEISPAPDDGLPGEKDGKEAMGQVGVGRATIAQIAKIRGLAEQLAGKLRPDNLPIRRSRGEGR